MRRAPSSATLVNRNLRNAIQSNWPATLEIALPAIERRTSQYSQSEVSYMKVHLIAAASFALIVASPAFASGKCTSAAKSKWQPRSSRAAIEGRTAILSARSRSKAAVTRSMLSTRRASARTWLTTRRRSKSSTMPKRARIEPSRRVAAPEGDGTGLGCLRSGVPLVARAERRSRLDHGGGMGQGARGGRICRRSACRRADRMGLLGIPLRAFRAIRSSPASVVDYLKAIAAGTERRYLGHNPAGAAMILVLLAGMAGTATTGWLLTTDTFWGSATDGALAFRARERRPHSGSARMSRASRSRAGAIARTSFARWSPASSARRDRRTSPDVNRHDDVCRRTVTFRPGRLSDTLSTRAHAVRRSPPRG